MYSGLYRTQHSPLHTRVIIVLINGKEEFIGRLLTGVSVKKRIRINRNDDGGRRVTR